jgi:hypoxanthine phosphoribosyltransferase
MDRPRVARHRRHTHGGTLHGHPRPRLALTGRQLLPLADGLDRGITLAAVEHELRRMNAASVCTAVLVRKQLAGRVERPAVDFVGTDAPDRFLFGCGMDIDGHWRGLPAVYALAAGA